MDKVDFVLMWVDGKDPEWLSQKRKYEMSSQNISRSDVDANGDCRYRDYGLLRYWFRAVEKFAPWVNKVFFVTCGQKVDWLNEACPKLRIINHSEFIPSEYLPTFQARTIELNLFRIADLSERFVLFNDDIFLLNSIEPSFFFKGGVPSLACDLGIPRWIGCNNSSRIMINDSGTLKNSMDVEHLIWKSRGKFFNIRALGFLRAAKNFVSFTVNRVWILGAFGHLALPHLKSTFEEIWHKQPKIMDRTSRHKFRCDDDVNQWLSCGWNMVTGRFNPVNEKRLGKYMTLATNDFHTLCTAIRQQSFPQICINDKGNNDPDSCFKELAMVFEEILPEKSSFEK